MMVLPSKIIIAIDGYSSCGKSSFAKLIARELNYIYLDSGAMYRSVAYYALQNKLITNSGIDTNQLIPALSHIQIGFKKIDGENITLMNHQNIEKAIRGVEVSSVVSEISKIPEVRNHLVKMQQKLGKHKGIVMDGRDIGTVVFPNAEVKLFMKADTRVRAQRRYDEMQQKGIEASLEEITKNITDRDYQDIHRDVSPLVQANDAVVLDNSSMSFEEQMDWFRDLLIQKAYLPKK